MRQALSDLQKLLLRTALAGHPGPGPAAADPGRVDATFAGVLAAAHGWVPEGAHGRAARFSRSAIGAGPHAAAKSALSRAAARLADRGLVTRVARAAGRPAGVALTPAGLAVARRLWVAAAAAAVGPDGATADELRGALLGAWDEADTYRADAAGAHARSGRAREELDGEREAHRQAREQLRQSRADHEKDRQACGQAEARAARAEAEALAGRAERARLEDALRRAEAALRAAGVSFRRDPPPAVPASVAAALAVLGLVWPCVEGDVKQAYRKWALVRHPDHGGSGRAFRELKDANDAVLAYLAKARPAV